MSRKDDFYFDDFDTQVQPDESGFDAIDLAIAERALMTLCMEETQEEQDISRFEGEGGKVGE